MSITLTDSDLSRFWQLQHRARDKSVRLTARPATEGGHAIILRDPQGVEHIMVDLEAVASALKEHSA